MSGSKDNETYSLPHGSEENTRLDNQHQAIRRLIGDKTFHAPAHSPSKILDIGCGSGIVTLELARRFPSAQIIGVDLAAVVGLPSLPPNVSFMQGTFTDLVETGALKENEFDYVFQRMLVMGVVGWQIHTNAAVRLLKPGGWLEIQDLSFHVYDRKEQLIDDRYSYIRVIQVVSAERGLDPFCGQHLAEYMEAARLRHISSEEFPWAWTYWSERPETALIAAHWQSPRQVEVNNTLLDKLVGSTSTFSQDQAESFKRENVASSKQAEEGVHFVYGVVFGQKATS